MKKTRPVVLRLSSEMLDALENRRVKLRLSSVQDVIRHFLGEALQEAETVE